ncbi:MAG: chorismate synthase [Bdellovibrionales bacterium]|nr:chorismate synthase [Bdellovibrionales bacterium]
MPGNSFGQMLKITTFGESHGEALGVIIDGIPGNLVVNLEDLKNELKRRAPGQHKIHTARKEDDVPEILSGVFENKTLGTPITVIVRNTNQKSEDYDKLKDQYRPGHADKTTMEKYGIRDHRGGGRASGRETLSRVIGGYFAGLIIPKISTYAYIEQVGPYKLKSPPKDHSVDRGEINIPDAALTQEVITFLESCKTSGESAGGMVAVSILNCPAGLGEPVFDKLKADLAKAMLSLPACTGFGLGEGFGFAQLLGSEVSGQSHFFGGMEGGISNGEAIHFKLAFKAPSTIGEKAKAGRHDPCVLPRVIPVVEAMAKLVLADHFLRQSAYETFLP